MLKRAVSILAVAALLVLTVIPAAAFGVTVGAPRMPKGGRNLVDLASITGDKSVFDYQKDSLICMGSNDTKYAEFKMSPLDPTVKAYVVSMWVKLGAESEDWTGIEILTNDSNGVKQSFTVMKNVSYFNLTSDGKTAPQAEMTDVKPPVGEWFKLDIYSTPFEGRAKRTVYINNQPLTNNWSKSPEMPLDASKPVLAIGTHLTTFEVSSIRVYEVDESATAFEDVTKPVTRKPAAPTTTTTTTKAQPTTTTAQTEASSDVSTTANSEPIASAGNTESTDAQTTTTTAAKPTGSTSGTSNVWLWIGIAIGVVLIGGGTACFFILKGGKEEKADSGDQEK